MQVYNSSSAFKEGHAIWVIPDESSSSWNQKIDWHCNLLLTRTKYKTIKPLPKNWEESGVKDKLNFKESSAPLNYTCITAKKNFPCDIIIEVPYNSDINKWITEVYKLSVNFKELPLRIFLPRESDPSLFEELWTWNKKHISLVKETNE